MWGRTPNWALNREYTYYIGPSDQVVLPAGSFVRPVEFKYLPKHILEDSKWSTINHLNYVFCYTKKGFLPIPKDYLREI